MPQRDKDPRYSLNWPARSRFTRALTGNRCSCCRKPAEETHHLYYGIFGIPVPGFEIPGVQLVPLCRECHATVAHSSEAYRVTDNPWKNGNTPAAAWKLRRAMGGRMAIYWGVPVLLFTGLFYALLTAY